MSVDRLIVPHTAARDLIAIAAASGGTDALKTICRALPADLPAAIVIVQQRSSARAPRLAEQMATWTSLDVRDAQEGDLLRAGLILIAPADLHMTITGEGTVALVGGGAIHNVLSSADPLFASAAVAYGDRLTAVVLTGEDGDGSAGVRSVNLEGGRVIAQDPASAFCGDMPRAAIATGMVDDVLPLDEIADALVARVMGAETSGREHPVGLP